MLQLEASLAQSGLFTVYLLSLSVRLSAAAACTASSARQDHRPAKTVRFGCCRPDVVVFTAILKKLVKTHLAGMHAGSNFLTSETLDYS
jgi:hypothetical protein